MYIVIIVVVIWLVQRTADNQSLVGIPLAAASYEMSIHWAQPCRFVVINEVYWISDRFAMHERNMTVALISLRNIKLLVICCLLMLINVTNCNTNCKTFFIKNKVFSHMYTCDKINFITLIDAFQKGSHSKQCQSEENDRRTVTTSIELHC